MNEGTSSTNGAQSNAAENNGDDHRNLEAGVFVDRKDILQQMENAFTEGFRNILLHGPPNLGKKEIASQFASRMRRQFNRALFINCAYEDVMKADLQSICHDFKLETSPQNDFSDSIGKLDEHLGDGKPFLIVLVDCQQHFVDLLHNRNFLVHRLSKHGQGRIIFTTSLKTFPCRGLDYKRIEVGGLTLEDSSNLIKTHLIPAQYNDGDLQKLHDLSKGFPGILERICVSINRKQKTVGEFLSTNGQSGDVFDPDEIDKRDFVNIQKDPLPAILFHLLCLVSPHKPFNIDIFKLGLHNAIKNGWETNCPHSDKLAKLADRLRDSNKLAARSILKDKLELPISHQLLAVTGEELDQVQVSWMIQKTYLLFIRNETNCSCDVFTQKVACLCVVEAMQHDFKYYELVPHLKTVLGHSANKEDSLFTYPSSISTRTRAFLARHYVEDGRFKSAAKLLSEPEDSAAAISPACSPRENVPNTCLIWLGKAHLWLSNCNMAINILQEAADKSSACSNPLENGVILTHLGSAKTEAGQPEEAERDFDTALNILPEDDFTSDYLELGLGVGESPGAYLLSRWGKLNRWKMFDIMSKMNSMPSKMEKEKLRKVIKASIDIFEQAHSRYIGLTEPNNSNVLVVSMYLELQKQHLINECQEEDDDDDDDDDVVGGPARLSHCEAIVNEMKEQLEPDSRVGWALERLGWIRAQTSDSPADLRLALRECEEGTALTINSYGDDHRKVSSSYRLQAAVLEKLGRPCGNHLKKAEAILINKRNSRANHPKLTLILKKLAQLRENPQSDRLAVPPSSTL